MTALTSSTNSFHIQLSTISSNIDDLCHLQTFESSALALYDELVNIKTNKQRHINVKTFKEISGIIISTEARKKDFPEDLYHLFSNEQKLDYLQELLYCPIDYYPLKEPILLDSGHTISFHSLDSLTTKKNPFNRADLVFKSDRATLLLMRCLKLYALEKFRSDSPLCALASHELESQPFFVNEHIIWMRLLSAMMPMSHYFVRKKNENHYVLVARLPVYEQNDSSDMAKFSRERSIAQISFYINNDGKICLISNASENTLCDNLEDLFKKVGLTQFNPITKSQIDDFENFVGKRQFLERCLTQSKDSIVDYNAIIRHLEARFSDTEIKKQAYKYHKIFKNAVFFRASINPASFPCITCLQFEEDVNKCTSSRVTFQKGQLTPVKPVRIIDGLFKISEANLKRFEELNDNDEFEKSVKQEYEKLKDKYPKIEFVFIPTSTSLKGSVNIVNLNEIPSFSRVNNTYYSINKILINQTIL